MSRRRALIRRRGEIYGILCGTFKTGQPLLLLRTTYDEAEILCDRVAIMDEGRIVALDKPDKMIV